MKLLISFFFFFLCTFFIHAQYKGSKYIFPFAGVEVNSNLSPTGGIGVGFISSEKMQFEFSARFASFDSEGMKSEFFSFPFFAYYKAYNYRKFSLLVGLGGIVCYQSLESKNELIEISTPQKILFGGGFSPKIEYLLSGNLCLFADYKFDYLFNSFREVTNHVDVGLMFYF